ncbi:hypothetical protein [Pseudomonas helleri]|uniref:hypothetical protein n=1 Tax=Pseudomonas helleri TaxID=1608996 RepID=UPI00242BA637|nr:hypothetical protein [Pseudomonas helleri]
MYRDAVEYPRKGEWLAPNSECYELYKEWKKNPGAKGTKDKPSVKQKLDALIAKLDKEFEKWRT